MALVSVVAIDSWFFLLYVNNLLGTLLFSNKASHVNVKGCSYIEFDFKVFSGIENYLNIPGVHLVLWVATF